jgi:hypothetical protein
LVEVGPDGDSRVVAHYDDRLVGFAETFFSARIGRYLLQQCVGAFGAAQAKDSSGAAFGGAVLSTA